LLVLGVIIPWDTSSVRARQGHTWDIYRTTTTLLGIRSARILIGPARVMVAILIGPARYELSYSQAGRYLGYLQNMPTTLSGKRTQGY
jgi:hypothetical protein